MRGNESVQMVLCSGVCREVMVSRLWNLDGGGLVFRVEGVEGEARRGTATGGGDG